MNDQLELTAEIPYAYPAAGMDPYNSATTYIRWVNRLTARKLWRA
jgi:hypothetical protein